MSDMKAPWMRIAHELEGESEIAGQAANPRIVEMFRVAGLPDEPAFRSDETAWCAAFANACLRCAGYRGTGSALASSFAQFGADLGRTPQPGCIVVFHPLSAGASGHVAFYVDSDSENIRVLGGNQHNKVQVSAFPVNKWRAYRWPSQAGPLPESTTLPTILTLAPDEAPDHLHAAGSAKPAAPILIKPVAADNFGRVHPMIEQWEGEFSDHAGDPGGPTNMGITQETLRQWRQRDVTADEVRTLQREEARQIFRAKYWQPLRCDEMPTSLAIMTYNAGVMSGIGRGARWLQIALNKQGAGLDVDGAVGPHTLSACARADVTRTVNDFVELQEAFLRDLSAFSTFGNGWLNRLRDMKGKALAVAFETPAVAGAMPETARQQAAAQPGAIPHPSPAQTVPPIFDILMQRVQQLGDAVSEQARRDGPVRRPDDGATAAPNDLATLLERVLGMVERLQPQGTTAATTPGARPTDQLQKALAVLTSIMGTGADGKLPLGQVNGALGVTLGNLLNGRKTAIGMLGAVITPLLSNVPAASGLGQVLGLLTPAFAAAAPLSGFAMPIFLALAAWGVLGKLEKWAQGTAPAPQATK
jgi:uncharacterized protein (TIGR02594 family)